MLTQLPPRRSICDVSFGFLPFTLLFGFASGAFSRGGTDPRLPVGFLDEDHSRLSRSRQDLLASPQAIRLHAEKLNTRPAWKQCLPIKS